MTWNHPLEATIYKRKFQVPGLDEVILHFNQSICVGEVRRQPHKSSRQVMPFVGTRKNTHAEGQKENRQFESETPRHVTFMSSNVYREVSFGQFRTGVSPFVFFLEFWSFICCESS